MHAIRIVLGIVLVALGFWPGLMAARILLGVVLPALRTGPNVHVHTTVIIGGLPLTGWQVYAAPAVLGIAALLMIVGGLFLAFSRSHDA